MRTRQRTSVVSAAYLDTLETAVAADPPALLGVTLLAHWSIRLALHHPFLRLIGLCELQRWMVTIAALYFSNAQAFAALVSLRRALIRIVSRADDVALGRSCYAAHLAFYSVVANTL